MEKLKSLFTKKNCFLVLFAYCTFIFDANAQIKVYSNSKVLLGPIWWQTWPGSASTEIFLNGETYMNCFPSTSGISLRNYHNFWNGVWYDEPIFEPQWANSAWIGNANSPYWRIYSREIYTWSGGVYSYSDSRLKKNITTLNQNYAINKILNLKSYSYQLDTNALKNTPTNKRIALQQDTTIHFGFIAQEVKDICPNLVKRDTTSDFYSINYTEIIPLLVESIKFQQQQIDSLKAEILILKKE